MPRYPSLFQINTRVWLTQLSRRLNRTVTLDDISDSEIDRLAEVGFDWIWLLSVWQTGQASRQISLTNPEWRHEFQETLPDLTDADIPGSGFAITSYTAHASLGGDAALARLRERLKRRGLRLMLDFVPNHMALDHPWVREHPDYFVSGTVDDLQRQPKNYIRIATENGDLILAHGRDPYFPGWPDTLQLNYGNPALQQAMTAELVKIAGQCDGVRCDMAMLVLPEVLERTWGIRSAPFWPEATQCVREAVPNFTFMAEVYWDLEWTMMQQGFNYAYDKRLYDRLREGHARSVREHLSAGLDYQDKLARFLENHDEPRAGATFPLAQHNAAAIITYLSPGLRFFHQGQFQGRLKRISPHLGRAPDEPVNAEISKLYDRLLSVLRDATVRDGEWKLLECTPAWDGNWTADCFVASCWNGSNGDMILVAVNYASNQSQCRVRLTDPKLHGSHWQLKDQLSEAVYDRDGNEMVSAGLYLDMTPWQAQVFVLTRI